MLRVPPGALGCSFGSGTQSGTGGGTAVQGFGAVLEVPFGVGLRRVGAVLWVPFGWAYLQLTLVEGKVFVVPTSGRGAVGRRTRRG